MGIQSKDKIETEKIETPVESSKGTLSKEKPETPKTLEEPIELFGNIMPKNTFNEEITQGNIFDNPILNSPNILGDITIGDGKIFPVDAKVYFNIGDTQVFYYNTSGITLGSGMSISGIASTFTETITAQKAASGSGAWEDWDISALVPVGTTRAEVLITNTAGSPEVAGVRKDGSAINRYVYGEGFCNTVLNVEVGTNRTIEIYAQDKAAQFFYITGYYT